MKIVGMPWKIRNKVGSGWKWAMGRGKAFESSDVGVDGVI